MSPLEKPGPVDIEEMAQNLYLTWCESQDVSWDYLPTFEKSRWYRMSHYVLDRDLFIEKRRFKQYLKDFLRPNSTSA